MGWAILVLQIAAVAAFVYWLRRSRATVSAAGVGAAFRFVGLPILLLIFGYVLFSKDVAENTMSETTRRQVALACASERLGRLFLAAASADSTYGPIQFAEECRPTWFRAIRYKFEQR